MKTKMKYMATLLVALFPYLLSAQVKDYFGAVPDLKVSGKNLVDPEGNIVVLHGVMDTPNAYFNEGRWTNGIKWANYDDPNTVTTCLQYMRHTLSAVANPAKGTYCNLFRLHLDPCWLQDKTNSAAGFSSVQKIDKGALVYDAEGKPVLVDQDPHGSQVEGEASIRYFSMTKLRKYLEEVYIPIAKEAIAHGMYVIIRPPGVFPKDVVVGDYYNTYLLNVWDILSQNEYFKSHSGQISFELGNEPVHIWQRGTTNFSQGYYDANTTVLYDFFQPILTKIRENGFNGIVWAPGTAYQAEYRSYITKNLQDPKNNLGFAAHFYPGWYGTIANDNGSPAADATVLNTFKTQIPVQANYPIVITEVDWSPLGEGGGHYDEHGNWVEANFGTWGTGSTSKKGRFGEQYKYVVDQCGNVSWTIEGSDRYVDMDRYMKDGTVQPAFIDQMKKNGYADAWEASSGSGFVWFKEYASGDKLPHGTPNLKPEEPFGVVIGSAEGEAKYDAENKRYCFYKTYSSAFIFNNFSGTELAECAELIIDLGPSTTGYRLDVQLKDKNGNIIKDGSNDYIIGSEAKGTRLTKAEDKIYALSELFADYITNYPGCTIGNIRINTAIAQDDANREGLYYITIDDLSLTTSKGIDARKGSKGTSLEDIKMYKHEGNMTIVVNDDAETAKMGGWGGTITRTAGDGVNGTYGYVLTNAQKNIWEAQVCYDGNYTNGTEYTLEFSVKGSVTGTVGAAFQKADGYVGCGDFPNMSVTTEWQTYKQTIAVNGEGANRLLINYGGFPGSLYIDNVKLYTGTETVTELTGKNIRLGEDATNGVEVFGAGLGGSVSYKDYADLSEYKKMIIKGSGGTLRVMFNRKSDESPIELNPSLASGKAEIDLTAYSYFHLNSIKAGWGQTVNVSSITLLKGDGSGEDIADYYITGAGSLTSAASAALADENATVIDLTGYTGKLVYAFESANPNCLLIYNDNNNVGFSFSDTRNLVKQGQYGTDAYRISLTDGYDFRAPFAFNTIGGASYTRNLTTEWATITLPFATTMPDGVTAYVLSKVSDDGKMTFKKLAAGTEIPALQPFVYKTAKGKMTLTGKNIAKSIDGFQQYPIDGLDDWLICQSMESRVIADVTTDAFFKDYDVYGISGDKFVHATKKLTTKPFRAFFLHKKSAGAAAPASFAIVVEDDEATDIPVVMQNSKRRMQNTYNLNGQKVSDDYRGVVIKNGRVILR